MVKRVWVLAVRRGLEVPAPLSAGRRGQAIVVMPGMAGGGTGLGPKA